MSPNPKKYPVGTRNYDRIVGKVKRAVRMKLSRVRFVSKQKAVRILV
jgi:hypothetical protein